MQMSSAPCIRIVFLVLCIAFILPAKAFAFSFSEEEGKETKARSDRSARVASALSEPCRAGIKGKKVAVLVAERHGGSLSMGSSGLLFNELNSRLKGLGLNTYTQGELTAQVARAEAEAILNNDPDAALAASKRLGASFFIKGIISARANKNMMVRANEVAVTINLYLTDASGRLISQVKADGQSWAGADVEGAALSVMQDQADELLAKLYTDFCRRSR